MLTYQNLAIHTFLILFGLGLFAQTVSALDEYALRRQGVLFHDTVVNDQCLAGATTLVGDNAEEQAFNFFIAKGLTPAQSAGIVGNLIHESGVMPNRAQGPGIQTISSFAEVEAQYNVRGFGIAQWTSEGRQRAWKTYAEQENADPLSLGLQLEFLWRELEQVQGTTGFGLEYIREAADARQAAWIFVSFFEKPATIVSTKTYNKVNQPTSGPAFSTLNTRGGEAERIETTYGTGNAFAGSATICDAGVGTPEFSTIPGIVINGSPDGAHQESNCSGDFKPGAAALRTYVINRWSPDVTSIGGYDCRAIVGGTKTSIHGLGRAIDIMIDANNPTTRETGDQIRNWLVNNAERLGVQRIIWNRKTWTPSRDGWNDYTGLDDHTNHLHVEVNIEASENAALI